MVLIIKGSTQSGRMKYMTYLVDIVIIAILVTAVIFIVRGQIQKLRRGQCSCGCSGCTGSCYNRQIKPVDTGKK